MNEGYYWISFNGIVQIAWLSNEPVEDIDQGIKTIGLWHLVGEDVDVCGRNDVKVLSARLTEPGDIPTMLTAY